jgi:hypothetical protein
VTRANAGQVGNTFTITADAAIGGSGSGAITGACSSSGSGQSNCIDIAFSINTTNGTYGTAASLATCGENNLNGNAPPFDTPNGICQDNGLGELVRGFRIGTTQATNSLVSGTPYDDGADPNGGGFNQSLAFTCNLVTAKIVQCVKGPTWRAGVPSLGQWNSGSTFIEYGDSLIATSRVSGLMGYPGGQSLPFTAGSGYTNTPTTPVTIRATTASCGTLSGGVAPEIDVWVAGGSIIDVYPSHDNANGTPAIGNGNVSPCMFPLTALGGGTGGALPTLTVGATEGLAGIGTVGTDSNLMGVFLYDNSGFPGNPLNPFFTNNQGGYFEPGLPVKPFGENLGTGVSG